jgi:hypothetical protein
LDSLATESDENDEKVGQVGGFGGVPQSSHVKELSNKYGEGENPPKTPHIPHPIEQSNIIEPSETLINQSTLVDLKFQPLSSFTKIMDDAKQKDLEKKKKKKTGRELQFWEDPQCAGIVDQCTKEQVLEWIKNNPNVKYKIMRKALGLGASRFVVELVREGLVKRVTEGWEITNAIQG